MKQNSFIYSDSSLNFLIMMKCLKFISIILVFNLISCKCLDHKKPDMPQDNLDAECETMPRILKSKIQLWEGWAFQIKQNNLYDQDDIKSRYTIAKTEILKYVHNVAMAFPDPEQVKNIEIFVVNIENFSIFADSLINGPYINTRDIISDIARVQNSKFDEIINACIKITNNCSPKINTDSVKLSLNEITMKDFDAL